VLVPSVEDYLMPFLPPEPNTFPSDLFGEEIPEIRHGRQWWVLHTKPRQEKSLARQLLHSQVPFYLPLIERRSLIRGRVLHAQIPLFPGYLFLLGQRDERVTALATNRVVQALEVVDQGSLWGDLTQVHRLIDTGAPITPEERLEPGALVEITRGPLAGLKGRIIRAASGRRFVVQVNFIQRGASVLIDDFNLIAVNEDVAEPVGR
jgi:transcriptional antiterminator RfaH